MDGFARLHADPVTARYLGRRELLNANSVAELLTDFADEAAHGWAIHWSCIDQNNGQFIGYAALHEPQSASPYLTYAIVPECRRQGYGSEVVQAVMAHAATLSHVTDLMAHVHLDNAASAALLSSLGFVETGVVELPGGLRRVFQWTGE